GFAVTIAPAGGVGEVRGRTEVVYGAMVNHYDPFGNAPGTYLRDSRKGITLKQATDDLIGQIVQASPHLRRAGNSTRQLNLDGKTALAIALRGTNRNTGLNERVTVVTRALPDGHVMYFVFVTPEQEAARYGPLLNAMLQSIDVDDTRHAH
ncbi:MAG TPA: hypothetical protein VF701_10450, partial [Thermoanaerobaculia bacterium]